MSAVLKTEMEPQTCGNCGHGRVKESGFVRCAMLKAYESMSSWAPCPLTPQKWTPVTRETLARREAQEGIERAVEAADREHEGWSEVAFRYVKLYATMNRGKRVIGREIVEASKRDGIIQASNDKAWGGAIQRAARAGLLRKEGFSSDHNRHTNPVPLWECVGATE